MSNDLFLLLFYNSTLTTEQLDRATNKTEYIVGRPGWGLSTEYIVVRSGWGVSTEYGVFKSSMMKLVLGFESDR